MKKEFSVLKLVLGALFLALALVLPFLTGQIPEVGSMLCPMHLPVLLAGFVCGGPIAAVIGFAAPLLRFLMFSMPPLYPVGLAMAFELMTYGLVSGVLYNRVFQKKNAAAVYISLLAAMVVGRVVWGVVRLVLAGIGGQAGSFTFAAFISGAVTTALPGILVQVVLIPVIILALQKAKLIDRQ